MFTNDRSSFGSVTATTGELTPTYRKHELSVYPKAIMVAY